MKYALTVAVAAAAALVPGMAAAAEYPAGEPKAMNGLEIAAVYLQPVEMEPAGQMPTSKADVHLEADIQALEDNPNGFPAGAWTPYLTVAFELSKDDGDTVSGVFDPMIANDGPHYGKNIKLDGPGEYHLKYTIYPPGQAPEGVDAPMLMRHTDNETRVGQWFEPFTVDYDFTYAGIGKKGSY